MCAHGDLSTQANCGIGRAEAAWWGGVGWGEVGAAVPCQSGSPVCHLHGAGERGQERLRGILCP